MWFNLPFDVDVTASFTSHQIDFIHQHIFSVPNDNTKLVSELKEKNSNIIKYDNNTISSSCSEEPWRLVCKSTGWQIFTIPPIYMSIMKTAFSRIFCYDFFWSVEPNSEILKYQNLSWFYLYTIVWKNSLQIDKKHFKDKFHPMRRLGIQSVY